MSGGNVDINAMTARWSYDDIWRICWMTVIFGALMPLSRSTWAMTKNFSLAMALHTVTDPGACSGSGQAGKTRGRADIWDGA